jgi:hypothetical protein
MNKSKIIEDQIRYQETLIGNLRYEIKQCKLPEKATHLQAQLAHALAGLAALCRDGESTKGVAVEVTEGTAEDGVARADVNEALATLSACFDHLGDVDWQPIRDAVRGVEENIRNLGFVHIRNQKTGKQNHD